MAFGTMLRGRAQTFYYQHLAQQNLPFHAMVERVRGYFHTPENHQLFLNEWRSTMLRDIIVSNPDKDLAQCLEIVIEKLQRTYQGLVQNFGASEGSLAGQLISACQGVPACTNVLIRPATTFEGVASDLRNAVGTWMRCQPTNQFNNHGWLSQRQDNDVFYTDRRYNRNDDRRPRNSRPNHFTDNQRQSSGYKEGRFNRNKKCFVCGKQDCWSTRHPPEERTRSKQRFWTYAQDHDIDPDYDVFLAQFEGIDPGNNASNGDREHEDIETFYSGQNDQFLRSLLPTSTILRQFTPSLARTHTILRRPRKRLTCSPLTLDMELMSSRALCPTPALPACLQPAGLR